MTGEVKPVPREQPTFVGVPRSDDLPLLDGDVAIIGIPYKSPYNVSIPMDRDSTPRGDLSPSAPEATRQHSLRYARGLHHYDFDFGGEIFAGRTVRVVDCGDVVMEPGRENRRLGLR